MHCRLPKLELIALLMTVENSNAQSEWQWKNKADITAILKVHTPPPNLTLSTTKLHHVYSPTCAL
jgi:hypothetical protein